MMLMFANPRLVTTNNFSSCNTPNLQLVYQWHNQFKHNILAYETAMILLTDSTICVTAGHQNFALHTLSLG